jgi:error-prone DNA polymerase
MYVELHAASAFSFLDGASLPEALIERAAELGYPALALMDRDGVYGAPRFHLAAKRAGIKAIVGAELTMSIGTASAVFRLPVLVESREGYRNLCRLVTRMKLRAPKGEGALAIEELDGHVGGLVALIGRTALSGPRFGVGGLVDRIVGTFGARNVCVEVQRHLLRDEEADNQALVDLASAFHLAIIATNGVRFAAPANRPLYDVLTCIRHKTTLDRAGRRLTWNAERYLKAPEAMSRLFSDMPHAVTATRDLADRLAYTMADLGYRFPDYPVPEGETMASFLRKITQAGARERYRPYHERARRQVERELDLIDKLELSGYFLIVWDIVNYCRQHDILVQGRGSAANSAVCYSLGITAVDPVGMDLLFERFLSEERGEWPDIDLDLPSGDRRERAIQHLYEKYGNRVKDAGPRIAPEGPRIAPEGPRIAPEGPRIAPEGPRIAMTANVITYRGRSAAREVGKVLSLETAQIDRLAKVMNHFEWVDPKESLERNLHEVGLDFRNPVIQTFGRLWQEIQDLPRHLGQHSGGMVICHGRLDDVVPLENASMPNRVVVQWDKDDCADMGIIKIDLLGLGMMSVLQDALELVNTTRASRFAPGDSPMPATDGGRAIHISQSFEENPAGRELRTANREISEFIEPDATSRELPANCEPRTAIREMSESFEEHRADREPRAASRESHDLDLIGSRIPDRASRHDLDLAHLPPDDPAVYRMLQEADTIGIFQVESRAQMATLPRLRPTCFYDIVVEVAIIRPGPIVGQMVHPYLKRRQGAEPVTYPHPSLEPILARTLGVPLFQEQLLRMAMVAAGFSGGEAEELRRAFGFKRAEHRMQQIEAKLRTGMARQGITGDAAEEIIRSITSFALYGFPESHAASFALLVYASAYLKVHYPAAFYTALLNNQPMGFYHPATLVKDAQRHGVRFAPIDVQESDWTCRVDPDGRVRLGLMYVNGLREQIGRAIAEASQSGAGIRAPGSAAGGSSFGRAQSDPEPVEGSRLATGGAECAASFGDRCPKCGCDDASMLEATPTNGYFCNICAHQWDDAPDREQPISGGDNSKSRASREPRAASREAPAASCAPRTADREPQAASREPRAPSSPASPIPAPASRRYRSLDDLIARTGVRRDELATLAEIGALNAFGFDRRTALWQIEKAVRPTGELFNDASRASFNSPDSGSRIPHPDAISSDPGSRLPHPDATSSDPASRIPDPDTISPLRPMTPPERLMADYAGTSLTIGPHPLALRRSELALRGVLRASDLPRARHGRRVRVAGAVITRQRPGTAKGFVFLTLEDETGIANVIVRPDLFTEQKRAIVGEPYLLVEGTLQIQEGVTSIKAERVIGLSGGGPEPQSHDFR